MTPKGYELKKGAILQEFGNASNIFTNDTLTDEAAEYFLKNYPEKAILFSRIPNPEIIIVPPEIRIIPPVKQETITVPAAEIPEIIEQETRVYKTRKSKK